VDRGDYSVRLAVPHATGRRARDPQTRQFAEVVELFNRWIARSERLSGEVVRVAGALAEGDLSLKMEMQVNGEPLVGDPLRVARTINALVDQTRDLNSQVRAIALVTTAVANGDLSKKITVEARGEIQSLKDTINAMVDQLRTFAAEVTRVAREVGTEGKLGGQAIVPGVSGTWKDLTDSVNVMASNLTGQVRGIVKVVNAVATGDLSQKFVVEAKGEIAALADTINNMTDTLRTFAAQVTAVAREVGIEGKLGGQARVPGVAGTWKDLTDAVNMLAGNLTNQVRNIALVTTAVAKGDLSQKITVDVQGEILELKNTVNGMTDTLRVFADQVTTVAREVGIEGILGGQARVPGAAGTWRDLTDNVNMLAGNLTSQVRNIALVTTAVANGDLSKQITVDARGEILELKNTVNGMTEQLRMFAAEVTRVAREVGTEGKLGGQAQVSGVAGTWKDLTDSVNVMASNLTGQVRGIVKVVTAVANGDLTKTLSVEAKGEIAALADTINNMTETLGTFAEQVTTVAREVGIEGKLGGQAKVPGAAGTWRDLTDNVNQLAGNLTTQVRAISEVASAVTKGDLTRIIDVGAQGEVLSLKDTINQMIANLRDTTQTNKEQDWLKTNLAKFSQMMQGQRTLETLSQLIMSELTPLVSAQHGAFYIVAGGERPQLRMIASYAFSRRKQVANRWELGEGLVGQCALEKKTILVTDLPAGYVEISSGLGSSPPRNVIVLPILFEGKIKGVIELASFQHFAPIHLTFLDQLTLSIGVVFNMISASTRTEELLEELKRSNVQLETRTDELEEKAGQLALVSKYKSEFLANMSHELRTPLNSMLILARLLAGNADQTLNEKQIEYARTIYQSGNDLLALISQILDLSKIEAGKMEVERRRVPVVELRDYVDRSFREMAVQKGLDFAVSVDEDAPEVIVTDTQRLQQILKNLLSNAFKFTERGRVELRIAPASDHTRYRSEALRRAPSVIAFAVTDTGIGIASDKVQLIFEAFQQGDASTSRTYGGTGLGLTISRELARLLGGEIVVESSIGLGSTFTLYLPAEPLAGAAAAAPLSSVSPPPGVEVRASGEPARLPERTTDTSLAGRTILLVDDDVRNLFAMTSLLEHHGAEVVCADSAGQALDVLRDRQDIELVLMDIMMPGMDGYQATREIRKLPRMGTLPIIAVTAKAMPGDREKCLEAGCSDFLPKPVDSEQLLGLVRSWLET
jgi:signal transduction histidine kinase/HAMP domain-containing protein/CheY-like chemotaxis protein